MQCRLQVILTSVTIIFFLGGFGGGRGGGGYGDNDGYNNYGGNGEFFSCVFSRYCKIKCGPCFREELPVCPKA